MTEKINTTISATNTFFDLDGNIVPTGNYYFEVNEIEGNEFKGDLIQKGKYGEFRFKAKDLVKMMSVGQARLARRANVDEIGIPKCDSPNIKQNRVFASFLSGKVTRNSVVRTYDEESLLNIKKENPICSICLTDITLDERELGCKHKFHKKCIKRWLERNPTCPICRKNVEEDTEVRPVNESIHDELFRFRHRNNYYRRRLMEARERQRRLDRTYWS